jgi:light-regulated signal transduction histidine kinase (bacteriophytochrome)
LQESLESLENILYHVAHDLRAPVRAMEGFAAILLEDYAPQLNTEGKDFAQRIVNASRRMDRLIFDLLNYGRIGHLALPLENVETEQCLKEAIAELSQKIDSSLARIQVDRPLYCVVANPAMLKQIFINLLSNAMTFVAPGVSPRILIRAEQKNGAVRLWMQDNGIGIDPKFHERIFRVFERLHEQETYSGTGVGLAIARKGLERMGGRIGVESQLGQGSRFWIELAQARTTRASDASEESPQASAGRDIALREKR